MRLTQRFPRLLGDIGGTHARLAWQAAPDAPLTHVRSLSSTAFPTVADAIEDWLAQGPRQPPVAACLGVATAVVGDVVAMTNHPWVFSIEALRQRLLDLAGWQHAGDGLFMARERHLQALRRVGEHLALADEHLAAQAEHLDLLAEELRLAQQALGEITGEFSADDLLGEIFSRFCIGK